MTSRLTPFSKFLMTLAILAGIFFLGRYVLNNTSFGKGLKEKSQEVGSNTTNSTSESEASGPLSKEAINVGVVTWGGYIGGQYFNEGFKANSQSRFLKEYGFPVEFKILDDVPVSREAWKKDAVNLLWCTIDALPTEIAGLADYDPVVVFQADWSRGGDAIVVRRGINSVADLKGKKIAVAEMTPSHSFLLWMLEAGGLKATDVEIIKQGSAIDAAQVFKSQQVDAAVVWSPDDIACLKDVPGSRILESTRSASNIIADAFIAKRAWLEKNQEKVQKLYQGWMIGAAEINASETNKKKAAKILAEGLTGFSEEDALGAINNVRLCTHGDNLNFFGLNTEYKGVSAEQLYSRMTNLYKGLGYAEGKIPSWRTIFYSDAIKSATALTGPEHSGEGQKVFTKANENEAKTKEAIATKHVSISFRTGEFQLDENSKYIIDKEFVEIAKGFSNSRIRIEGNTDNVGSEASNIILSKKRAQSVVDYLVNTHKMSRNRFVVIGNGPNKSISTNDTEEGRAKNRRTDFELIGE